MEEINSSYRDLRSEDGILRRRALGNLVREAEAEGPSASLVRACVCRLADGERAVRRFSADALADWLTDGPPSTRRAVRTRLREALDHRNPKVASSAAQILSRDSGSKRRLIDPLLRGFSLDDEEERRAAAETLTRLVNSHRRLATRLRALARRGTPVERRMALYCLRDLPPSASVGPDPFLRALSDPDPIVRSTAASSLGRLGRRSHLVLDGLLRALTQDPSILIRRVAAVALGQIAPNRRDVRASLEETMEAEDPDLRRAARHALARLAPPATRRRARATRPAAAARRKARAPSR